MWWYCPMSKQCALIDIQCEQSSKHMRGLMASMSVDPELAKPERLVVQTHFGKRTVTNAGAGFQGLSNMQVGGLHSIAGTLIDIDTSHVIFSLPNKKDWPNSCIQVLSPLIRAGTALQLVETELCEDGRATVTPPKTTSMQRAMLSLSGLHYVQLEVERAIMIDSKNLVASGVWKPAAASLPYYHVLDMGGGAKLCLNVEFVRSQNGCIAHARKETHLQACTYT